MTTMPETIDRGEPITPEEVGRKVREYRRTLVPEGQNELQRNWRVIVHPQVFEDAYMRVHELSYWSDHPKHGGGADLRCCGMVVDHDPSLRLDGVRLRREETL